MANFDNICRMAADNTDLADFVVIYIEEAHPTEGWALPGNRVVSRHRTIEDRLSAAATLASLSLPDNMTVVADAITDELNQAYGAVPERLYIIQNGIVEYEGGTGPFNFHPKHVEDWLKKYRESVGGEGNVVSGRSVEQDIATGSSCSPNG